MKKFLPVLLLVGLCACTAKENTHTSTQADGQIYEYKTAQMNEQKEAQAEIVIKETTEQSKILMQKIEAAYGEHNIENAVWFEAWEEDKSWIAKWYDEYGNCIGWLDAERK